mgnify:FL=1
MPRPWLVEMFREERKRPPEMVVAPAGYGKTILMATIAEEQIADGAQQFAQMLVGFLTLAADLLAGTLGRKFIFRSSKVLTDTWQVAITQGYPTITPANDFIRR